MIYSLKKKKETLNIKVGEEVLNPEVHFCILFLST